MVFDHHHAISRHLPATFTPMVNRDCIQCHRTFLDEMPLSRPIAYKPNNLRYSKGEQDASGPTLKRRTAAFNVITSTAQPPYNASPSQIILRSDVSCTEKSNTYCELLIVVHAHAAHHLPHPLSLILPSEYCAPLCFISSSKMIYTALSLILRQHMRTSPDPLFEAYMYRPALANTLIETMQFSRETIDQVNVASRVL